MKKIRFDSHLILLLFLTILYSCSIETYSVRKTYADNEILSYIADNDINITPDSCGLAFVIIQSGFGSTPQNGDKVAFHYKGYFMNGEVFDSSYDKKYPLVVEIGADQMIEGLEIALLKMNKSSKAKVIIPFYLAYDDMENAPVPPYSNLIFDLELIDFMTNRE